MSSKENEITLVDSPLISSFQSLHYLSFNEAESHRDIEVVYVKTVTFHWDLFRSVKVGL